MERKQLIRPITIEKVKVFMRAVSTKIQAGETFSLDVLARSYSISGSTGTAMVRNNWIELTDVKHQYSFHEDPYVVNDSNAKLLIEQVRLQNMNGKLKSVHHTISPSVSAGNSVAIENKEESDDLVNLKQKSLKSPDFALVLEKIFSKMNEGRQGDIFGGITSIQNERIHLASAISSGVWASCGSEFPRMSDEAISEVNSKIIFAANDLMDQLKPAYQKVNK